MSTSDRVLQDLKATSAAIKRENAAVGREMEVIDELIEAGAACYALANLKIREMAEKQGKTAAEILDSVVVDETAFQTDTFKKAFPKEEDEDEEEDDSTSVSSTSDTAIMTPRSETPDPYKNIGAFFSSHNIGQVKDTDSWIDDLVNDDKPARSAYSQPSSSLGKQRVDDSSAPHTRPGQPYARRPLYIPVACGPYQNTHQRASDRTTTAFPSYGYLPTTLPPYGHLPTIAEATNDFLAAQYMSDMERFAPRPRPQPFWSSCTTSTYPFDRPADLDPSVSFDNCGGRDVGAIEIDDAFVDVFSPLGQHLRVPVSRLARTATVEDFDEDDA